MLLIPEIKCDSTALVRVASRSADPAWRVSGWKFGIFRQEELSQLKVKGQEQRDQH